jgi:exosortase/archaeosortase family protein
MSGRRGALMLSLQVAAFWPVWQWYGARVVSSTDGRWGALAALSAVAFLLWRKGATRETKARLLLLPALLLLLYAVSYPFFPPLLRAAAAFTCLGCTLGALRMGRRFHAGLAGLLYLSLPVTESLQFYGGYPLRVLVASVAAMVLQLGGFLVVREGTCLNWGEKLIWVDAPCSGVRMLWVGLYLACALAALYELRLLKLLYALSAAFVIVIGGNIFRAVALFYLEAGIVEMPAHAHDYVGVVVFVMIATSITFAVQYLGREKICALQPST